MLLVMILYITGFAYFFRWTFCYTMSDGLDDKYMLQVDANFLHFVKDMQEDVMWQL